METIIRKARHTDLRAVLDLVVELAVYEREPDQVSASLEVYQNSFEKEHFEAFVAEQDTEIIGVALFYRRFSTWKGPMLHLEDFVVREKYRRQGVGKMLFEAFINEGASRNVALCIWQVIDWNDTAINFYKKYDVEFDNRWIDVKMRFKN